MFVSLSFQGTSLIKDSWKRRQNFWNHMLAIHQVRSSARELAFSAKLFICSGALYWPRALENHAPLFCHCSFTATSAQAHKVWGQVHCLLQLRVHYPSPGEGGTSCFVCATIGETLGQCEYLSVMLLLTPSITQYNWTTPSTMEYHLTMFGPSLDVTLYNSLTFFSFCWGVTCSVWIMPIG